MSEMPFLLQLNGPCLARSFCRYINYTILYIYGCRLITSDLDHGLANYAPAHCCSCHTCICVFSLCSGFSTKKNGAKKNPPRIPVAFCDAPLLSESPYALSAAYRLNVSLRARVFFSCFPRKNKNKMLSR